EGLTVSDTLVPFDKMTLVESVETNGTLDVNETWTLTYSYKVTEADVAAGTVLNAVKATDPDDPDNPVEDELEVHKPSYTVVKEATEDKFYAAGDEIHYTVTVTNTGKVAVEGLTVSDTLVPFDKMTLVESVETNGTLDVNETWTLTYSYKVTQADMDAGFVTNAVKATNPEFPDDDPDNPPPGDELEIPGDRAPGMTVVKRANKTKFKAVGDVIRYTVVVTNTGNVTLTDVKITDTLVDLNAVVVTFTGDVNINGELDVGETWTYTYNYVVKRSDLNAGRVPNTVSVISKELSDPLTDKVTIPAERLPDRMDDPASGITTINVGDCYE
ncbi:MAG: DUF7507 domain-containing protein, partial [Candidatus Excrementavichristensenella sp.]